MIFNIWYMIYDILYIYDIWYMIYDIYIIHERYSYMISKFSKLRRPSPPKTVHPAAQRMFQQKHRVVAVFLHLQKWIEKSQNPRKMVVNPTIDPIAKVLKATLASWLSWRSTKSSDPFWLQGFSSLWLFSAARLRIEDAGGVMGRPSADSQTVSLIRKLR